MIRSPSDKSLALRPQLRLDPSKCCIRCITLELFSVYNFVSNFTNSVAKGLAPWGANTQPTSHHEWALLSISDLAGLLRFAGHQLQSSLAPRFPTSRSGFTEMQKRHRRVSTRLKVRFGLLVAECEANCHSLLTPETAPTLPLRVASHISPYLSQFPQTLFVC